MLCRIGRRTVRHQYSFIQITAESYRADDDGILPIPGCGTWDRYCFSDYEKEIERYGRKDNPEGYAQHSRHDRVGYHGAYSADVRFAGQRVLQCIPVKQF